jgi:hypothetical protein
MRGAAIRYPTKNSPTRYRGREIYAVGISWYVIGWDEPHGVFRHFSSKRAAIDAVRAAALA